MDKTDDDFTTTTPGICATELRTAATPEAHASRLYHPRRRAAAKSGGTTPESKDPDTGSRNTFRL
jgi:hypothetical protein